MTRRDVKRRAGNVRAWIRRLWTSLTSGLPTDWESTETFVQRQMRAPLREYVDILRNLDDLAFELLRQTKRRRRLEDVAVYRVHATLLVRVLQDVRVAMLTAQSGYTMQSWSLVASAFEAAHTMGFIGADSGRANDWLNHKDAEQAFCPVKTALEGSFKYLEIGGRAKRRVAAVAEEYALYHYLCMAKHVNPVAERTRYVGKLDGEPTLTITPRCSERGIREARLGLILACRAAIMAIWVFHKTHGTCDTENPKLHALTVRTAHLLDTWKSVAGELGVPGAPSAV